MNCHREQRHVSQQLSLAYDRRQIILERSEMADKLAGQYVDVYDFSDRPLEVRWKGHSLPYRVFSKDQRVSHTAIIEKQAARPRSGSRKSTTGREARDQGKDQQRKDRLQEARSARVRPDYQAESVTLPTVEMTV